MATCSSFAEIIENDFLNCNICLEKYRNPKYLPCHHTYCEECLRKLVPHKTKVFQCPECRQEVTLNEGGISNLKTNFFINSLLNILPLNETIGKMCSVCPSKGQHDRPAVTQCFDCPSFMCQLCTDDHLSIPSQHQHKVLRLSDTSCDAEIHVRKKIYCAAHPKKEGGYFCRPCNASICDTCLVNSHSRHEALSMSKAAESSTPAVRELVGKLSTKVQSLTRSQDDLNAALEKLKAAERSIESKMVDAVAQVQSALFKQRDDIRKKMSDFVKQQEALYETAKADLQRQTKSAESTRDYSERVLRAGQNGSIVCLEKILGEQVRTLLAYQPPSMKEDIPKLVVTKDYMSQMDLFRIELGQEAAMQKIPPVPDQAPEHWQEFARFSSPELPPVQSPYENVAGNWLRPARRCNFTTECYAECNSKLTGVSMLNNGDIIVADEANGILKCYSIDGDFRRQIAIGDTGKDPCSVAVCGDLIACTAESKLYFLDYDGDRVRQLLLRGSESSYPITAYEDQYVVVSEGSMCSLSLYGLDGQVVDRVKPQGYQGIRFLFVAVSSQENFIVSDIGKKCLVIFRRNEDVINICDEIWMQGVPRSLNPFGVCVDSYDDIYVGEPGCIISFSPEGIFKQEVLASLDGINMPRALTVDEDDNLIVTQTDGEVYVYELFLD
ncbi:E3 ubiquitin-protein ligase TRIM56 isoform X3 [Callorhinchus milii]|uniref:E3 ubiquitin-protein ligase TRIM56 isoform X2 n=1 Tax=Callorhinchus milii TaxID=7868 RepID=UPI00045760B1|nr:E3 ubiquitin-protein ligase TRIM56 isoform X2 [Callorhinchus milii]XP_042201036.1 E3 ubiquitin-protein ligase TRIM56 isoform X3 [Callorhinchus milii]|eukprot:gi/632982187/ref/XP_007907999.1/ PREDICTED: E3 ubiquitin-protein ligase TRIM56-like isoform X2 [Callorhinchus milii]